MIHSEKQITKDPQESMMIKNMQTLIEDTNSKFSMYDT